MRIIEIYYILGVPVLLAFLVMFILIKRYRAYLFAGLCLVGVTWYLALNQLENRSFVILETKIDTVHALVGKLGSPDLVFHYPEGDSDWVYTVRVWPWNAVGVYSVYHDHIISFWKQSQEVHFFYKFYEEKRSKKISDYVIKELRYWDNEDKVNRTSQP